MVVAVRGDSRLPLALAEEMTNWYATMDALVKDEAFEIEKAYLNTVRQVGALHGGAAEIVVVGWSDEKSAPVAILLAVGEDRRFEIMRDGIMSPSLGARELTELGLCKAKPGTDYQPNTFDPKTHGVAMIEAQRRKKVPAKGTGKSGYCVGGDVDLTILTADGVTQETVHRWTGDEIGEQITPTSFVATVVEFASRQQRRVAEREQRKLHRRAG